MDQRVHNVFAGHLRSIVGSMTVEECSVTATVYRAHPEASGWR